ncbi:hypothetical protein CSB45_00510 [candidate division KSB3 bacterium]|uniref:RXYLT1 C-terminal domain-containing protein n=1 Tax=candidate division KSB3 bacterium TaxID=2044937 RepID=A0A2G6EET7_9BACT|nr:MAG: hypothetical protein CSB45_00510 [candidate division KSB3 bacterium]
MAHKGGKPQVLLLRSYSKANVAAIIAGGLRHCDAVDYWQYPPWPSDRIAKLKKLPHTQEAWENLHVNLINSVEELSERLSERYFDLILLTDYDAHLCEHHTLKFFPRLKAQLRIVRYALTKGWQYATAYDRYARAIPFSFKELKRFAPLTAIDLSDPFFLTQKDQKILQASSLYFKRELPFDRFFLYYQNRPAPWSLRRKELLPVLDKVYGIPLGIEDTKYRQLKEQRVATQEIDVLFAGEITNTLRRTGLNLLQTWAAESSWNIVTKSSLSFQDYCDTIARSKITISIAGGGWDCFRHYEAPALGSLPLLNRPTIDAVWWHSMPKEIFFENTFENFRERIERLLEDDALRQRCFNILEHQIEEHMLHSKIIEYIIQTSLDSVSRHRL